LPTRALPASARGVLGALALNLIWPTALAAALGAPPATETAPETRRGRWEQMRREKLAVLQPPRAGFLEKRLLAVEKAERPSLVDWNLGGFYPRVGTIGWGSLVALGVRFWQPDWWGKLDVHGAAFYSLRRFESYDLQVGFLPHRGKKMPRRAVPAEGPVDFADELDRAQRPWLAYVSARYHHLPEVDYFGLDNDSHAEDRTTFLLQDALFDLAVGYQPTERTLVMVRSGVLQAFVASGRDEDVPSIEETFPLTPGLVSQPDFIHLTGVAAVDGRDEPGNPHRGALLAVSASHFDDRGTDAFRFDRVSADARAFVPLGSPQRVLAVRAVASVNRPADGARVPFYLQQTLGGSHSLRGFPSFRFRGERLLLLQAEYRWEAVPALELALYVDAGRVSPYTTGWSLDDLHTSYGAGLRVKTFDAVHFRFDVARSVETTRLMVRFGPAF
jgi:surface antigen Omp85-like protein